jgi:hypothetical protein
MFNKSFGYRDDMFQDRKNSGHILIFAVSPLAPSGGAPQNTRLFEAKKAIPAPCSVPLTFKPELTDMEDGNSPSCIPAKFALGNTWYSEKYIDFSVLATIELPQRNRCFDL